VRACDSIPNVTNSCGSGCYAAMGGDANPVAACQILRFTTKNFAASLSQIRTKI
jgi:hypothetical protein